MVLGDEGFKSGALGSEERERERERAFWTGRAEFWIECLS